jgi:hypothetical protein
LEENKYKRALFILIGISTVIRIVTAAITELGNDEVYYWTYALFPSLSYFDHPPMVGMLIRATTINLIFNQEIFVRLGAIICGSINLWLIFKIGQYIKNSRTGLYASFLYAGSLYGSIIAGTFILPDSPQTFFWLLTMFFFLKSVTKQPSEVKSKSYLIFAGITAGLALLSKYHSAFLWFGALIYIILYNRQWLKQKELYISLILSAIFTLPILLWNYHNDFISFTFHSSRAGFFSGGINFKTFITEISGQIFYNNPVNFVLILISLYLLFRKKFAMQAEYKNLLLLTGLPVIITFIIFSLTRTTFPHWSAPGYFSLILITSVWLESKESKHLYPLSLKLSNGLIVIILFLGILSTNYGFIKLGGTDTDDITKKGNGDVTLEMYGWKQIGEQFKQYNDSMVSTGTMKEDAPVITSKWYDAAHAEYYVSYPLKKDVYCLSSLLDSRNYHWLNEKRKPLKQGMFGYFIITSHDYKIPDIIVNKDFASLGEPRIFEIRRGGEIAEYAFVYKIIKLKE